MTLLRRIILLLAIALAPMQLAWAGQMSTDPAGMAMGTQAPDLTDCCKDGSHQTPTCQIVTALPVERIAFAAAPAAARDTHPRTPAAQSDSRAEAPALRPPIPA